jgi:hypothetical protein
LGAAAAALHQAPKDQTISQAETNKWRCKESRVKSQESRVKIKLYFFWFSALSSLIFYSGLDAIIFYLA